MKNTKTPRKQFGFFSVKKDDTFEELEKTLRIGARKTFGSKSVETSWVFAQTSYQNTN